MEPEQPTSWPPAPTSASPMPDAPKLRLLMGKKGWDTAIGGFVAFLLFVSVQVLEVQWIDFIFKPLLSGRIGSSMLSSIFVDLLFSIPSLIGLLLAATIYLSARRWLPILGRAFGLMALVLIVFEVVGRVFISS